MTNPKSPPQPAVSVEQADRDAAASLVDQKISVLTADYVKSGKADDYGLVQAFARHRLRHTPDREAIAQQAVLTLHELSEANKEIAVLRDIVVTYGDKLRMGTVHRMDWQQAIDRAFDREN